MSKKSDNIDLLNYEEQSLLDAFNEGKLKQIDNVESEIAKTILAAKNHLKKDACINIRLSQFDLVRIKRIAASEGLPYQTLISSILHKFVNKNLDL